jgi:hypothetical protein
MNIQPTSRILVLDDMVVHTQALKQFCDERNLVLVKIVRELLMSALESNVELGAIVLSELYAGSREETTDLASFIRAARPEIPIVLRREQLDTLDDLPEALRQNCCAAYVTGHWENLESAFDEFIFALVYPNALVRGITEISEAALTSLFTGLSISGGTPFISRDRVIFGEVFSLIPLESAWCRGYVMLQVEEQALISFLECQDPSRQNTFHNVNSILGEATNLIWGGIKNRFIDSQAPLGGSQVQVPLVINHHRRYISFGSEKPQLCFQYRLVDPKTGVDITVSQRFVFSLNWSPEDFTEVTQTAGLDANPGELTFF